MRNKSPLTEGVLHLGLLGSAYAVARLGEPYLNAIPVFCGFETALRAMRSDDRSTEMANTVALFGVSAALATAVLYVSAADFRCLFGKSLRHISYLLETAREAGLGTCVIFGTCQVWIAVTPKSD